MPLRGQICQDFSGGPFSGGAHAGLLPAPPPANCPPRYCIVPELVGLKYELTTGTCNPQTTNCTVKVTASVWLPGASNNEPESGGLERLLWKLGSTNIGSCGGVSSIDIAQDRVDTFVQLTNFRCTNPTWANSGTYTLEAKTCVGIGGGCAKTINFSIPVTHEHVSTILCRQPPQTTAKSATPARGRARRGRKTPAAGARILGSQLHRARAATA